MKEDLFLDQDIMLVELVHLDHMELLDLVQDPEQDQEQDHQDSLLLMEQELKEVQLEQATTKISHLQVQDINLIKLVAETQVLLMFQEHLTLIQAAVTLNSINHMVEIKDRDRDRDRDRDQVQVQVQIIPTNQEDNDLFIFIKIYYYYYSE
jgi:hypothetical protein